MLIQESAFPTTFIAAVDSTSTSTSGSSFASAYTVTMVAVRTAPVVTEIADDTPGGSDSPSASD